MTVPDFCADEELLGKCVVLIHGGGEHKNYIGESEKEKLSEHLRRGTRNFEKQMEHVMKSLLNLIFFILVPKSASCDETDLTTSRWEVAPS